MRIAAIFVLWITCSSKNRKQSKRPSIRKWIYRLWYDYTMKYYSAKKPDNNKNTTNPCKDMDESQKHYYKQDARYKQHELYNSTDLNARTAKTLTYGDRSQNSGCLRWVAVTGTECRGAEGTFQDHGHVLAFDSGGFHMGVHDCQRPSVLGRIASPQSSCPPITWECDLICQESLCRSNSLNESEVTAV